MSLHLLGLCVFAAAANGHTEILSMLMERDAAMTENSSGNTPLSAPRCGGPPALPR
jgi:hypothetical protein